MPLGWVLAMGGTSNAASLYSCGGCRVISALHLWQGVEVGDACCLLIPSERLAVAVRVEEGH